MKQEDLHDLPFDVYTRNKISGQAIQIISDQVGRGLRVLDIGGRSGEFSSFITGQELSIIDIREPETAADKELQTQGRYFLATGINTSFSDGSFDVCTAFEVLEHLKPEERQPLLEEMYRVSKLGIVVSAPVNSEFNDLAERTLNSFFERLTGKSHPWLVEHIENRPLPEASFVNDCLKQLGAQVLAIPSNNTFLWSMLQYLAFTNCKYKIDFQKINALYNDNFECLGDGQGPVYRNIFIALKPEVAGVLERIMQPLSQVDLSGKNQLKILDAVIEEFVQQISSRSIEIQQKEVHINNLQVMMHDKDVEITHATQSMAQKDQKILEQQSLLNEMQAQAHALREYSKKEQKLLEKLNEEHRSALRVALETSDRKEQEINQLNYQNNQFRYRFEVIERKVEELEHMVVDKDRHIQNIEPYFKEMLRLQHSKTFKITQKIMGVTDKLSQDAATGINIFKYEGFAPFLRSFGRYLTGNLKEPIPQAGTYKDLTLQQQYQMFLNKQPVLEEAKSKSTILNWKYHPTISIVVPVYNVNPEWLTACIESVQNQFYTKWELCLYDDASTKKETIECLQSWNEKDDRIKIKFGKQNLHICGATNQAIQQATGDFIGLLDNDDELTPDALFEVVKALNANQSLGLIYSDEDKKELDGTLTEPHFKSDFNLDLLLSINYISHFTVIRKDLGDRLGWLRPGFEGSQDYDLYLRLIDETKNIHHIPKVLYHWRKVPGSTAARYEDKKYVDKASLKALSNYLQRNEIFGKVQRIETRPPTFRVKRSILAPELVSIIIPFKDKVELLKMCVPSILEKTSYKNYEILLVSNNSTEPETFEYVRLLTKAHPNIRFLEHNVPFNYSEVNNWAVKHAKGPYVLLMNNDIEVISSEWLSAMVEHIQRQEVGAVGAKLYYPNNTIQHAGVMVGLGGVAGHSHKYFPQNNDGYFARVNVIQDLSACTAACLLVKKSVFEEVQGLDDKNLKIAFNDVDFCLKIRKAGYLIVYTPFAELYHHESVSRGQEDTPEKQARFQREVLYMKSKYGDRLLRDPYYNPNLSLDREDFSLAI